MNKNFENGNGSLGLMTAVLGGAIGAATALFFSDKRRRAALRDVFMEMKDRKDAFQEDIEGKLGNAASEVRGGVKNLQDKAEKTKTNK